SSDPASIPPVPPSSLVPPLLPPVGSPHALLILSHGFEFTQSIWYWYADFWHSVTHWSFAPTGMKLHWMTLSHAVPHDDGVAPVPPPGVPPPPLDPWDGGGTMFVRHAGSQTEFSAHDANRSICLDEALSQSA